MSEIPELIGYRRVSTAGQVDRYGLPAQAADLEAYERAGHCRLLRTETDEAKAGSLPPEERPALLAALRAIEDGEADGLLLPGDLDRLARELVQQEAILSRVWKAGGVVHATSRGEIPADDPDDPMRTALRQFLGVIAQLDRALTARRLRNGRLAKAAAGGYAGFGSPAFGQASVDGDLVADEAEQAVIARIRELRGQGLGYLPIAAALNAEGLKSKRGGFWSAQTVKRVVQRLEAGG
jgi:DNA invertase Pin-like site-specific DNA recombinase